MTSEDKKEGSWISCGEAVQKEARTLFRKLHQKDVAPVEKYHQYDAIDVFPARLSDAQYLVARRYGFKSWVELTAFLRPQTTGNNRYVEARAHKTRRT